LQPAFFLSNAVESMNSNSDEEIVLSFKWLRPDETRDIDLPAYATEGSSGMDVHAASVNDVEIGTGDTVMIPTGFALEIPSGYEVQVRPRSGLAIKHGITIVNAPGTIDSDYRGEVKIGLINVSGSSFTIHRGDRIAQLVVAPVTRAQLSVVDNLSESRRGVGGFGHTGIR